MIGVILLSFWPNQMTAQQKGKSSTQSTSQSTKPAQDDDILKVNTQVVSVPFSITDKKNKYITDIKAEEISVTENGKQQEIASFIKETDLPLTFAILFDISGSQEFTLPAQKSAALHFLEKILRPEKDIASVITFRKDIEMIQGLTGNVGLLRRALTEIKFTGATGGIGGAADFAGTSLYDSIYVTSDELLAREAGRRVIILLTDGRDTTSSYSKQKAIDRSLRSEVLIYAVGIQGRGQYGGQVFSEDVDKKTLQTLCEETGGRFFYPKNESEYDQAFQQIEEDLRQQYILTYSPNNDALDGSFRTITVKLNRKEAKDLKVLCRRGYYAKKG